MAVKTIATMAIRDGGDHVASAGIAENAISGHGRGGLDHDDAVQNQVPKRERSAKAQGRGRRVAVEEWLPFPRIGLCRALALSTIKTICKFYVTDIVERTILKIVT